MQNYRAHLQFVLSLLFGCLFAVSAWAAVKPFDQAAFAAAQAAGKPILVEIHADWCPTCRAQDPIISELMREPKNAGFVVLRVDFDKQKAIVRHFHVLYQSTLIVFKGKREVSRSTGETRKAEIEAQLAKAY